MSGYGIPNTTDESAWTSLDEFKTRGLEPGHILESKKGEEPKKVRIYDLEYRPLIDRDLTDKAMEFMEKNAKADRPFFVYLPYTATHFPTMPHPDFKGKTGNGPWADLLMQIDNYTGELLDKIDELGVAENTIFIFTADNGPEALDSGSTNLTVETAINGSAGPWRGTLFTGFEGALRVPFVVRWPGKIAPGTASDEIVHAMDIFPTVAELTGGEMPKDRVIEGINMTDFFLGKQKKSGRDGFIVYMGNDIFGVKWKNWKLHFKEQDAWNSKLLTYTMPRVYDLYADPQERNNVLFPHTWVPRLALVQLSEHVASLQANPPIKVGQPDPYSPEK